MSAEHQAGDSLAEDLKSIEAALGGLTPAFSSIDRERLIYAAGRASVKQSSRIARFGWPLATATMALISVTFGRLWLAADRDGPRIVYVKTNEHQDAATMVAADPANQLDANRDRQSYFQLR